MENGNFCWQINLFIIKEFTQYWHLFYLLFLFIFYSGNKPINPVRYTNCGHFFCSNCADDSKCYQCDVPVRRNEIRTDHTILNLIRDCDAIANVIKEE